MRVGSDKRSIRSILQLSKLLLNVCSLPMEYRSNVGLMHSLKSQGALAKYRDADLEIFPLALNTIKRVCENRAKLDPELESLLQEGYKTLDLLRIEAANAIVRTTKEPKNSSRSKSALFEKATDAEAGILACREDCMQLTLALSTSVRTARTVIRDSGNDVLIARWRKAEGEIYGMIAMLRKDRKPSPLWEELWA